MKGKKIRGSRKARVLFGFLAVLGTACLIVFMPGYLKVSRLKKEILQTRNNIEQLKVENENLNNEIQKLKNDPFTIEKIAREKLGLVRKGEVKVRFYSSVETESEKKVK